MTPEEKAVIDAAVALVEGVRAGRDPVLLDDYLAAAVDALIASRRPVEPMGWTWYPRTYADVREGDTIRHGHGQGHPAATVLSCVHEPRHVKDGGTGRHWDDKPVEHMLTRVRLDYPGNDKPERIFDMPSNLAVDIRLTAEEFRAIELLGWENRV